MYADFDLRYSDEYPYGVFCICGRTIHLKESEVPYMYNRVTCPVCGHDTLLIRPKATRASEFEYDDHDVSGLLED